MKVLFAVSNENISTQIVKRYQKEYKEIISYKNVYYFNAIVKELQRDKSYDRIVISEDLEPFANNNSDAIEKFIFEKLDNISDEAEGINGKDIPIILLATDKRTKSEPILVKLFGIGIYDILLGTDRNANNVCSLLNKPRSKKEAKLYYKIEAEEVSYKSENENNVSETEIKNILNYYKRLGKDEDRYIESFNNIAAQYNDAQLRIITKFLPLNVKAVLEEKSAKYQSVMTFSDTSTADLMEKKKEEEGLKVGFLNYTNSTKPTEPVIVPKAVKRIATKKINNDMNFSKNESKEIFSGFEDIEELEEKTNLSKFDDLNENVEPVKRGRGRPKKVVPESETSKVNVIKRGRGRPKKITQEEQETDSVLPGFDDIIDDEKEDFKQEDILPGFEDITDLNNEDILPGFDDIEKQESEDILPGFDDITDNEEEIFHKTEQDDRTVVLGSGLKNDIYENNKEEYENSSNLVETNNTRTYSNTNDLGILSKNKKIVSFVGTTKNGTSFLVNNIAKCLSDMQIKTAILDLTSNRNAYYIYTKNDERLRNIAYDSIKKLNRGIIEGISVDKNLDVYTALPGEETQLENPKEIITTLEKDYSVILIDCDFETPVEFFKIAQEIYLVQTMDILTIQPMTAFLRDLKAKELLDEEKIRVIINKEIQLKDLTPKVIIGGLSKYNDPSMTFMTELFDRKNVKYFTIPFNEKVCSKYLQGVMDCKIEINTYPKDFNKKLKELASVVYPLLGKKQKKLNDYSSNVRFSEDMNNTLEQMRKRY